MCSRLFPRHLGGRSPTLQLLHYPDDLLIAQLPFRRYLLFSLSSSELVFHSGRKIGGQVSYCTYNFFDQCPHRMAFAQCSFYVGKESTRAQIMEARANLLRLRQEIPLSEPELAVVEQGLAAYEKLTESLRHQTASTKSLRHLHLL